MAGGDRRRQRQRVRHEAGGLSEGSSGVPARDPSPVAPVVQQPPEPPKKPSKVENTAPPKKGVSYAEPKHYESVTIMESKPSEVTKPPEGKNYRRREILSNWSRYDIAMDTEEECGSEDYLIGEDFEEVLEAQSLGSGGFLLLKEEKLWGESDANILNSHGLGSLRVTELAQSLRMLPVHQLLAIPKDRLPANLIRQPRQVISSSTRAAAGQKKVNLDPASEKILNLLLKEFEHLTVPEKAVEAPKVDGSHDANKIFMDAFIPEPDVNLDDSVQKSDVSESSPEQNGTPSSEVPVATEEQKPTKKVDTVEAQPTDSLSDLAKSATVLVTDVPKAKQGPLDFGLRPKGPETAVQIPKLDTGYRKPQHKGLADLLNVEEDVFTPPEKEDTASTQNHQTVSLLDEPIEAVKKPVFVMQKSEAEDLEDWLDSVLDD